MRGRLFLFAVMVGLGIGAFPLSGHALPGPLTVTMTISRILDYPVLCKVTYSASNTQSGYPYYLFYRVQKSSTPPQWSGDPIGYKNEPFSGQANSISGVVARLYQTFGYTNSNKAYLGWVLVDPNYNTAITQGSTPNDCR